MTSESPIDWAALIDASRKRRPTPLKATLFLETLKTTGWRTIKLRAEDGCELEIKEDGAWVAL